MNSLWSVRTALDSTTPGQSCRLRMPRKRENTKPLYPFRDFVLSWLIKARSENELRRQLDVERLSRADAGRVVGVPRIGDHAERRRRAEHRAGVRPVDRVEQVEHL